MQETTPPRQASISPLATGLTLACVAFAVVLGITGPRLRDRHGSVQQDHPLADVATVAALHERRAERDAELGRGREAALERLPALLEEAAGRDAPDLSAAGLEPVDARIAELAPGLRGVMIAYGTPDAGTVLTLTMLPDLGDVVRLDGFGRALPLAPGEEWIDVVADEGLPGRTAWAMADGRTLWLVLAGDRADVAAVARLLR
jgi:hypothetical protein